MKTTTDVDVDVAADAALVYLEEIATAGFGLSFSSHAAVEAVIASLVETIAVAADADVVQIPLPALVVIAASGLLFFFSSVAAATTTVAANS